MKGKPLAAACVLLTLVLLLQTGCSSLLSQYAFWADERRFHALPRRNQLIYGGTVNGWHRLSHPQEERSRWELNRTESMAVAWPFFFVDFLLCVPVDTVLLPMSTFQQMATNARLREDDYEYGDDDEDEDWERDERRDDRRARRRRDDAFDDY